MLRRQTSEGQARTPQRHTCAGSLRPALQDPARTCPCDVTPLCVTHECLRALRTKRGPALWGGRARASGTRTPAPGVSCQDRAPRTRRRPTGCSCCACLGDAPATPRPRPGHAHSQQAGPELRVKINTKRVLTSRLLCKIQKVSAPREETTGRTPPEGSRRGLRLN